MLLPPELWAIFLFAGQMLDVFTTRYALTNLGGTEANPLMKALLDRFGFTGMQIFKAVLGGSVFASAGFLLGSGFFWAVITGVSWFPVVWDTYQIWRGR